MTTTSPSQDFLCRPLGKPLPDSVHAVSVSLPTWEDVVGYEEGSPRVVNALETGYPRFVFHPIVARLFEREKELRGANGESCLVLANLAAAKRAKAFLDAKGSGRARVEQCESGLGALLFPEADAAAAKAYWQHSGEIVSSRRALAVLEGRGEIDGADKAREEIAARLAGYLSVPRKDVFLFPSGMAGLFHSHRILSERSPGKRTVQLTFPYVDTWKIQEKFGSGGVLYLSADEGELQELDSFLSSEGAAAVFCEVPSNPLLTTVDLGRVREITRKHGVPLVIDDTIATSLNLDLSQHADLVFTSLTKYFSGVGDTMAGAITLMPNSDFYEELSAALTDCDCASLWGEDAKLLEEYSRGYQKRVIEINANAEALCDFLVAHPDVERVFFPKFVDKERFAALQRKGAGYGGVFSLVLKDAASRTPQFYDALRIAKGPSLGTDFTIACPYTLLAHYLELDWAESCGVSRYLIRVSVGREDKQEIISRFSEALRA